MSGIGEAVMAQASADLPAEDWDDMLGAALKTLLASTDPGEKLWLLAAEIRNRRQSLQRLEAAISRLRARDILTNGAVVYADTYITVAPTMTRTLVDKAALIAWAQTHDPAAVEKLWRLDARNLRITTLRGIAERAWRTERGSPDADLTDEEATHLADYVRATEDTFVEVTRGDPILTEKPVHKSPQWVQKLNHGERAKPKGAR